MRIGRRLLRLVFVLFVVTFVTFWLLDQAPGDPAEIKAGLNATPEVVAEIRAELGLDQPFVVRYLEWVGDAIRLDFGDSLVTEGFTSWELIREALPKTIELMILAELMALAISMPLAIHSARRPNGWVDRWSSSGAFGLLALPAFVLGIYLSYLFGVRLGWLPTIVDDLPGLNEDPLENLRQMFLPSFTLALGLVAVYLRLLRSDLIDTLQQDYIMLAQARGLHERRVLWRHALRPSSVNLMTAIGLNIAALIGGAFIIEVLFAINGMGRLTILRVGLEDFPVVAAVVAILTVAYVTINFVVDLLYRVIDPRIRDGVV